MPGIVDQLQSAGFSDDEIGATSTQLRTTLSAAGFGEQEIDDTLGGPKKPAPPAFLERVTRGLGVNGLFDEIGRAGVDTFKAQALAPALSPETENWARDVGLFNKPGEASPIRTLNEAMAKSSASAFAMMGAVFSAGVSEIGAGVSGIGRRLGASETQSEAARREVENLANALVANSMAGGAHAPMTRIERSPTGEIHDVPIGGLPENSDFANATRTVVGVPAPVAAVRAKIESLWQDHGIHPAEVVHDAETDPTIAQDLASSGKELPQAYVAPAGQPREGPAGEPVPGAVAPVPGTVGLPPVDVTAPAPAHPYATVEIRPNPGGGFDVETPLEGIQHAATMEDAQRLQARYTRLDGEQAVRYEQETGRNYADDWRNNEVDAAAAQRAGRPAAEPAAPQIRSFSPNELRVDPERFQFKAAGDSQGVTERLQGVDQWDPIKGGLGIVYEDEAGTPWIVDGHQRLALASRIGEADPAQQPRLNAWTLRAADGVTDADARAFAAAKNIAEGTGSPIDAAKVLRDRPDLLPSLPPRSELVRQARGLMNLDPEAFLKTVNGVVPANYAAIVGRLVPDNPAMQNALVDLLAKTAPDNAVQAESIVRQGIDAGLHHETQATLFGDQDVVSSLYGERARILDGALRQLRRDKTVFKSIVDNRAIIEELGNRLAQDENARQAATDGYAIQILQTLANRKGGIGDSLTAAARAVADGSANRGAATRDFVAEIRRQAASGDLARLADGGVGSDMAAASKSGSGAAAPTGSVQPEHGIRDVSPAEDARAQDTVEKAITPESEPGLFQNLMRDESGAVSLGGTPTPPRTAAERAILDRVNVGGQTDKRPWTWSRLYTNIVNAIYPIEETTGRAAAELGREIPTSDNPAQLARLMSGAAGKADHWLNFSTFDFATYENNGPSLKAILEPVKDDLDGLRAFATSVRTLELENRGIKTGMNLGAAREVTQAGLDHYTPILAELIQYQDRLTRYLRDSGVLSAKGYEAMREANELYVPFHRVFDQSEASGFGGPSLQAQNPIHRIKGSERAVVDPIESIVRNTFLYTQMAERNAVGVKLVDLLREAGDAHGAIRDVSEAHLRDAVSSPTTIFADRTVTDVDGAPLPPSAARQADLFPERGPIEREAEPATRARSAVPEEAVGEAIREALRAQGLSDELFDFMASSVAPAENEIGIFRDGKREVWQVDRELAGAMKALDRQSIGAFERLLSKPASWLRAGAVLNPDFQLRHTFRDYLYAAITSPGFFSPIDMARGFIGLIARDADFQDWLKSGGANISRVALDRRYLQENLRQLNGDTGLLVRAWNVVADPDALYTAKAKEVAALPFRAADKFVLNPLRMMTELAENASHLGAFKKAMGVAEEGGKEAIQAAGFASRDIAVDASRIGARTRAYNMITAFANITIQDTDRVARAFISNPTSTALKIGGAIVLPSALLWWANHDDTRYAEIPQWEKDLFWIVMTGKNTPGDPDYVPGHIFRIPKPWGMGVIFGSGTERALQAYFDGRPDALREYGKSIADTVVPQFYPTAVAPIIDQFANRSTFTNRTLVPSELEKQLPEYQYTPYTTETAKKLAQLIAAFPGVRQESLDMQSPLAGGVARGLTTPILLENYLRAWSGNLGVYALQVADAGLRNAGLLPDPPRPADTLADIPVVKAFVVRYPGAGAESIELFYRGYELNKRFFDTWMAKAQEGDEAALTRIQDAGGPRLFVQLDGIRQTLAEHSQLVRDIWKDPEMPPDEKRQLIDQIYYSQIQIAQAGRTMMTEIDKALATMPADATVH